MLVRAIGAQEQLEAKEAIASGLLGLTYQGISGEGADGDVVFGQKPSRRFISGFLLPMLDPTGTDDESSDVHISAQGLDFRIARESTGPLTVTASLAVYIRVLPSWDEITCPRHGLMPRFMLRPDITSAIGAFVRHNFDVRMRDQANLSPRERKNRAVIRRELYQEACVQEGLPADIEVQEEPQAGSDHETDEANQNLTATVQRGIPDALVSTAPVPQKWLRISIEPVTATVALNTEPAGMEQFAEALSTEIQQRLHKAVAQWVSTPEGQEGAYRDMRILPSDIASEQNWNAFLARARQIPPDLPGFFRVPEVIVSIVRRQDFNDPTVDNMRVIMENTSRKCTPPEEQRYEMTVFQTKVTICLPKADHQRLPLERIKPSYRFRDFFTYGALGVNGGVNERRMNSGVVCLLTTWLPRYHQPRLIPRDIPEVNTTFSHLASSGNDLSHLTHLVGSYSEWIDAQRGIDPAPHIQDPKIRAEEEAEFKKHLDLCADEILAISKGIRLLEQSRAVWRKDPGSPVAVPYLAWLLLNSTMAAAWKDPGMGWRLFQLAFILAHIAGMSSRMPEFAEYFDPEKDEESASLLYFPTGGGKSEAFYGLLVFNLFLDRLRGKHHGITALIRYPLRLLTLQQAQRLLKLLCVAEIQRLEHGIYGDPFAIGFWVGSANTPNSNRSEELEGIVAMGDPDPAPDTAAGTAYRQVNASFNKIPSCPVCGSVTGLRRGDAGRVAIVCGNAECLWHLKHGQQTPLPFYLTDDDIYAVAPPVILGTIDKLALVGQHDSTINKIAGMFGAARYLDVHGRLQMPRKDDDVRTLVGKGAAPLAPANKDGREYFFDPFPSITIIDEAHLLEESLGTFAGLFDSTFEALLLGLAPVLGDRVAKNHQGSPRLPKVIAATATISSPERQIEALYQRRATRYPSPGISLYESFFSIPQGAPSAARDTVVVPTDPEKPEVTTPWMRVYTTLMTNGRVYSIATATTLGAYHVTISRLWRLAQIQPDVVVDTLQSALDQNHPLHQFHLRALDALRSQPEHLQGVLDLFRIALVYVLSKKSGDHLIDTVNSETEAIHNRHGVPLDSLRTELISGGVDIGTIQRIIKLAEEPAESDSIDTSLRSIVATSAISHGVDLSCLNAMFFVGQPSDIAEYIQSSSRVGRTHVGFTMLLTVPHVRRDRFILETHTVFHRFLEQMVQPAATERWAEQAIRRSIPSLFQCWLNGVKEQEVFFNAQRSTPLTTIHAVRNLISAMGQDQFLAELIAFIKKAIGVYGRGAEHIGRPGHSTFYENLVEEEARTLVHELRSWGSAGDRLKDFWPSSFAYMRRRPMTSLRDIDEAGLIVGTRRKPGAGTSTVEATALVTAIRIVRNQSAMIGELDGEA